MPEVTTEAIVLSLIVYGVVCGFAGHAIGCARQHPFTRRIYGYDTWLQRNIKAADAERIGMHVQHHEGPWSVTKGAEK